MELTVGTVLEGKVKSITNFGAFITLPEGKTGMVHISEVAGVFVSDIRQYLTEGQEVKVMVISTENGKINLSIKRLEAPRPRQKYPCPPERAAGEAKDAVTLPPHQKSSAREYSASQRPYSRPADTRRQPTPPPAPKTADQLFEEKLKQFMTESDSKISSIRQYSDHRTKSRRR